MEGLQGNFGEVVDLSIFVRKSARKIFSQRKRKNGYRWQYCIWYLDSIVLLFLFVYLRTVLTIKMKIRKNYYTVCNYCSLQMINAMYIYPPV